MGKEPGHERCTGGVGSWRLERGQPDSGMGATEQLTEKGPTGGEIREKPGAGAEAGVPVRNPSTALRAGSEVVP